MFEEIMLFQMSNNRYPPPTYIIEGKANKKFKLNKFIHQDIEHEKFKVEIDIKNLGPLDKFKDSFEGYAKIETIGIGFHDDFHAQKIRVNLIKTI